MRTNPFVLPVRNLPDEEIDSRPGNVELIPFDLPLDDPRQTSRTFRAERTKNRFLRPACILSAVFLVLVMFVFREIDHARQLYRMSRLVAQAEAQTYQWQEKQRLEEARAAGLIAALYSQQHSERNLHATTLRMAKTEWSDGVSRH